MSAVGRVVTIPTPAEVAAEIALRRARTIAFYVDEWSEEVVKAMLDGLREAQVVSLGDELDHELIIALRVRLAVKGWGSLKNEGPGSRYWHGNKETVRKLSWRPA